MSVLLCCLVFVGAIPLSAKAYDGEGKEMILIVSSPDAYFINKDTGLHTTQGVHTPLVFNEEDLVTPPEKTVAYTAEAYFEGSNAAGWTLVAKVTFENGKVYTFPTSEIRITNKDMSKARASVDGVLSFAEESNTHKEYLTIRMPGMLTLMKKFEGLDSTVEKPPINVTVDGQTYTLSAENGYKKTIELPAGYYDVTEEVVDIDGYTLNKTRSITKTKATVIPNRMMYASLRNSYHKNVNIKGQTIWEDNDDQDGLRPDSITVNLLKRVIDLEGVHDVLLDSKTVTADDDWSWTFENKRRFEDNGMPIICVMTEEAVVGYLTEIVGSILEYKFTITNSHTPEKIDVAGSKTWDDNDNQDGKRPESVTIRLLADGVEIDSKVISEADDWKWSFEGLDKCKAGKEISYTIAEDAVEGYKTEVSDYDVTNSYTPEKTLVKVAKTWQDANNQDGKRPANITITLLADGVETDKTLILNANNNWTGSFTDLDEYNAGKKIEYTVKEEDVKGYAQSITGNATEGFVVTNKMTPKTITIAGKKTWVDDNDKYGKRPSKIVIRLFANGVEVDKKVVTEAKGWKWEFKNLDKYEDGEEIIYAVSEDLVEWYVSKIDQYDVINTYSPKLPPSVRSPKKPNGPKVPGVPNAKRPPIMKIIPKTGASLTFGFISLIGLTILLVGTKKGLNRRS